MTRCQEFIEDTVSARLPAVCVYCGRSELEHRDEVRRWVSRCRLPTELGPFRITWQRLDNGIAFGFAEFVRPRVRDVRIEFALSLSVLDKSRLGRHRQLIDHIGRCHLRQYGPPAILSDVDPGDENQPRRPV